MSKFNGIVEGLFGWTIIIMGFIALSGGIHFLTGSVIVTVLVDILFAAFIALMEWEHARLVKSLEAPSSGESGIFRIRALRDVSDSDKEAEWRLRNGVYGGLVKAVALRYSR